MRGLSDPVQAVPAAAQRTQGVVDLAAAGTDTLLLVSGEGATPGAMAYRSGDAGRNWAAAPIGDGPYALQPWTSAHLRPGQELLVASSRNRLALALSTGSGGFEVIEGPALTEGETVRSVAGTEAGWVVLVGSGNAAARQRLLTSPDGRTWTAAALDDAGITGGDLNVNALAAAGEVIVAAGIRYEDRDGESAPIEAVLFSSTDAGLSWSTLEHDPAQAAPRNSGWWTATATPDGVVHLAGWGWDDGFAERGYAGDLTGVLTPGRDGQGTVEVSLVERISGSSSEFEWSDLAAAGGTTLFLGNLPLDRTTGSLRSRAQDGEPGPVALPGGPDGSSAVLEAIEAVAGGYLVASTRHLGRYAQPVLHLVDLKGRAEEVELPAAEPVAGVQLFELERKDDGGLRALGAEGSRFGIWEQSGEESSWVPSLALDAPASVGFRGYSASSHGEMLHGRDTTTHAAFAPPVLWERSDAGDSFQAHGGGFFARRDPNDLERVNDAAATSRGALIGGWFAESQESSRSALALTGDFASFERAAGKQLSDSKEETSRVAGVGETADGTLLAVGSTGTDDGERAAAWFLAKDSTAWERSAVEGGLPEGEGEFVGLVRDGDDVHAAAVFGDAAASAEQEEGAWSLVHLRSGDGGRTWTAGSTIHGIAGEAFGPTAGRMALDAAGGVVAAAVVEEEGTSLRTRIFRLEPGGTEFTELEAPEGVFADGHPVAHDLLVVPGGILVSGVAGAPGERAAFLEVVGTGD
ncbi:hypothetical protein ACQ3I4_00675 [Zafaria sp. Z1313]|uniref:hypothetical protein n=1 Tax=Zafaria sp. Z1313 TaxID=3423202 RepID=UPI003D3031CF